MPSLEEMKQQMHTQVDSVETQVNPAPRTPEQINEDYKQLCAALGDNQVKQAALKSHAEIILKRISALADEMTLAQADAMTKSVKNK